MSSEIGEFHHADGWYFKRLEDGSVRIRNNESTHVIPACEWASIIASVSRGGETSLSYGSALVLHGSNGEEAPAAMRGER